jgi:hypothetical protein
VEAAVAAVLGVALVVIGGLVKKKEWGDCGNARRTTQLPNFSYQQFIFE